MPTTLVVVSVSDRIAELNRLVRTVMDHHELDDWPLTLLYQDYGGNRHRIAHKDRYEKVIVVPNRLGCHAARVQLLRQIEGDSYLNLDDDLQLTEHTNWQPAVDRALEFGNGFVLTNWAPNWKWYWKRVAAMDYSFSKAIMLYQGGGMAYGESVAELMRRLPAVPARFDDIWPLTAYLKGYQSWRYFGSMALHEVCRTGGMHDYMKADVRPVLGEPWINYRRVKNPRPGADLAIPNDRDLTEAAHLAHLEARTELMRGMIDATQGSL